MLGKEMEKHKADSLALLLCICEEEVPHAQQERSPSLGQEEPMLLQIKEEQEELLTSQEPQGLEEADIINFTFSPVSVKSEHDEVKPQSSWFNQRLGPELLQIKDELDQGLEEPEGSNITVHPVKCEDGQENALPFQPLQTQSEKNTESYSLPSTSTQQMKTEPDFEDCGVSEPASNLDPAGDLEPYKYGRPLSSDCSGTETDDSDFWKENGGPQSSLITLKLKKVQNGQSTNKPTRGGQLFSSDYSGTESEDSYFWKENGGPQSSLITLKLKKIQNRQSTGEKPFSCSVCENMFSDKINLNRHMRTHTGEKPFSCLVCEKVVGDKINLNRHMRTHTGENPFSCTVCEQVFNDKVNLNRHMRTHTGEKPFSCSVCKNVFSDKINLNRHMKTHTGEKPFSSVCKKVVSGKINLNRHMITHTGDKPFSCLVCEKVFSDKIHLNRHMRTHTREKPFSCSVCEKVFSDKYI